MQITVKTFIQRIAKRSVDMEQMKELREQIQQLLDTVPVIR